jgi:CRISPR/Cas system-associated endoribonuclease Cas2
MKEVTFMFKPKWKLIQTTSLLFMLTMAAAHSSHARFSSALMKEKTGNGGNAVVCFDSPDVVKTITNGSKDPIAFIPRQYIKNIVKIEARDLYAAKLPQRLGMSERKVIPIKAGESAEEYALRLLERLKWHFPTVKDAIDYGRERVIGDRVTDNLTGLFPSEDIAPISPIDDENKCVYSTIAYQTMLGEGIAKLAIDPKIFNDAKGLHSEQSRGVIYLHEWMIAGQKAYNEKQPLEKRIPLDQEVLHEIGIAMLLDSPVFIKDLAKYFERFGLPTGFTHFEYSYRGQTYQPIQIRLTDLSADYVRAFEVAEEYRRSFVREWVKSNFVIKGNASETARLVLKGATNYCRMGSKFTEGLDFANRTSNSITICGVDTKVSRYTVTDYEDSVSSIIRSLTKLDKAVQDESERIIAAFFRNYDLNVSRRIEVANSLLSELRNRVQRPEIEAELTERLMAFVTGRDLKGNALFRSDKKDSLFFASPDFYISEDYSNWRFQESVPEFVTSQSAYFEYKRMNLPLVLRIKGKATDVLPSVL